MAGLLAIIPLVFTLWVIRLIITLMGNWAVGPATYLVGDMLGFDPLPFWFPIVVLFIGVLIVLLVMLLIGWIITTVVGRALIAGFEAILKSFPVIGGLYHNAKVIVDAVSSGSKGAFRQVVLVEFPHQGMWSLGFLTGTLDPRFQHLLGDEEHINLFVPTTPNPTSGFFVMVPRADVIVVDITVEDAFKLIASVGIIQEGNGRD